MKFECKDLERALETPDLLPDARQHARFCDRCRRDLLLWTEMSAVAGGLRHQWDSPTLWPQIREQLGAEPRRPAGRRFPWRALSAIAAVLLLFLGSVAWLRLRPQNAVLQKQGDFLTEQALRDVEQAESAYVKSIGKLTDVARPQLENPASPLTAAYREKLELLDAAIADLKAGIDQNRFNSRLQVELAALYKQKQQTLQEIVHRERKN